uniref:Uncharacterized protein AlNc14C196G8577 n=1 Tax=Albugo laibachii Nc14 TaxID=890382 RepID=F0WQ96_9STRA|nr:conserved hypothetical protein [Albugo laibachii Nc14]|eukprot:CCA23502.1 conserved hypothetical protein [Albugo laibachii Nc14]
MSSNSILMSILRAVFVALCPSLLALVFINDVKLLNEFKRTARSLLSSSNVESKISVDQVEKRAVQQLQAARDELHRNVDEMCFLRTGTTHERTKIFSNKTYSDRNGPLLDTEKSQASINSWNSTRNFVRQWLRPHQRHSAEDVEPVSQLSNLTSDIAHNLTCSANAGSKKSLYDEVVLHLLDHEFFAAPRKELPSTINSSSHPRYAISEVPVYFMEPTTRMFLKVTNNNRIDLTSDPDVSCLFNIVKGKTHHWGFQSTVTQRYLGQNVVGKVVTAARKFNSWESFRVLEVADEEESGPDNQTSLRCSKPIYFVLCSGRFGKGMWLAKSRRQRKETVVQPQADGSSRHTIVSTGSVYLSRHFRAAVALRYASNIAAFDSISTRTRQTARVHRPVARASYSQEGSETESGSELKEELLQLKKSHSYESDEYEDKISGLEESESFEIEYSEKPDDALDEVDDVGSSCESAVNTNENEGYTSEEDLMDRILERNAPGEYSPSTPIAKKEQDTFIYLLEYITLHEGSAEHQNSIKDAISAKLEPQEFSNVQCYDILALCIGTIAPEHSNWQLHPKWGYVRRLVSLPLAESTSPSTGGLQQRVVGVEQYQSLTFLPNSFEKDGFVFRTTLYTTGLPFSNAFGASLELKFIPSIAVKSQLEGQTERELKSFQLKESRRLRVEAQTSIFWTRHTSPTLCRFIKEAVHEGIELFHDVFMNVVRRASDLGQTDHSGVPAALRSNLLEAMETLAPVRSLIKRRFDLILAHLLSCSIVKTLSRHSENRLSHSEGLLSISWGQVAEDCPLASQFLGSSVDTSRRVVSADLESLISPRLLFEILFSNAATFAQNRKFNPNSETIDSDDNVTAWMHTSNSITMEDTVVRDLIQDGTWARKQSYKVMLSSRNRSVHHAAFTKQYDHYRMGASSDHSWWLKFASKVLVPYTKIAALTIEIVITVDQRHHSTSDNHKAPEAGSRIHVAFAAPFITYLMGSDPDQKLTIIDGEKASECLRNGIAEIWEPIIEVLNLGALQAEASALSLSCITDHQNSNRTDKVSTEQYRSIILLQLLRKQMPGYREATMDLIKKCFACVDMSCSSDL